MREWTLPYLGLKNARRSPFLMGMFERTLKKIASFTDAAVEEPRLVARVASVDSRFGIVVPGSSPTAPVSRLQSGAGFVATETTT